MKIPKSFSKMLENKYVLYFVLFLTIVNLLGYLLLGNFNAIIFFILAAFLTSNFSRNMIVVLSIPLILTSVFMVGKVVKEGFATRAAADQFKDIDKQIKENKDQIDDLIKSGITTDDDRKKFKELNDNIDRLNKRKEVMIKERHSAKKSEASAADTTTTDTSSGTTTTTTDSTATTGGDTTTTPTEQMSTMYKKENRIDYASTVEDAYDDLNKILGGDGIKKLTDDTQKLMKQQMQLADAMKSMTPLMEQAQGLLKGFDLKSLSGLAGLSKNPPASIEQLGVSP